MSPVWGGEGVRKLRPTASRLRPDYLADFLHEQIWRTFYIVVLPDFLAYYFPRFHVQKDILSYLNITNWPSISDWTMTNQIRQKEQRYKFCVSSHFSQVSAMPFHGKMQPQSAHSRGNSASIELGSIRSIYSQWDLMTISVKIFKLGLIQCLPSPF